MLMLLSLQAVAQDTTSIPEFGWKHSLLTGLTLTQVAFTDWAQGGENALAYSLSASGKSTQDLRITNWVNTYQFAFGQTRLGNQGLRKTEDIIDLSSVFTYKLGSYVNPYGAVMLKSQFAKGYMYDASGTPTVVSNFFDPAYLTQSAGVGYQPIKEVRTRLGLGLREILTNRFPQFADDPSTATIEKISTNGGMESVTNVDWQIEENILFTTQLEIFSSFNEFDRPVIRSSSALTMKVNTYISSIVNLQLINEPKITPRTQLKESIALGLTYTIF